MSDTQQETKVSDDPSLTDGANEESRLPATGSAKTLTIFAVAVIAGTLFWEWRLRHRTPG